MATISPPYKFTSMPLNSAHPLTIFSWQRRSTPVASGVPAGRLQVAMHALTPRSSASLGSCTIGRGVAAPFPSQFNRKNGSTRPLNVCSGTHKMAGTMFEGIYFMAHPGFRGVTIWPSPQLVSQQALGPGGPETLDSCHNCMSHQELGLLWAIQPPETPEEPTSFRGL